MKLERLNVVIAVDSFKESLDAISVAKAVEEGWKKVLPKSRILACPMSDGGEGFLTALSLNKEVEYRSAIVSDLRGKKRRVKYGWLSYSKTAVIETAEIVGLHLVPSTERRPEQFTSYGVGEIILKVIRQGAKQIVLGLGGSGVNDGGAGIAQALGYSLLTEQGKEIEKGPLGLQKVAKIKISPYDDEIRNVSIVIATDVKNPYYGPHGATFVYGPQKGLKRELCTIVDKALKKFAKVIKKDLRVDVQAQPGSGSAGGMGGALFAFANGKFISGFHWLADINKLHEKVLSSNLIITGEGQLDFQSVSGKVVGEIIRLAKEHHKPVIVLSGRLGKGWDLCLSLGDVIVFPVSSGEMNKEELFKNAYHNIRRTAEQIAKIIKCL